MDNKKIGLIALLVIIVAIVAIVLVNSNEKQEKKTSGVTTINDISGNEQASIGSQTKEMKKTTLEDGTLYTATNMEEITNPEIVLGDNYFDTTVADINLNFDSYANKTIQVEGMYISSESYTFVGRYSTSNLCADCPQGFSYIEYEAKSDNLPTLTSEQDWIKIKGILKKEYDPSIKSDYYYIDVASLEVMNERGQDTVSN